LQQRQGKPIIGLPFFMRLRQAGWLPGPAESENSPWLAVCRWQSVLFIAWSGVLGGLENGSSAVNLGHFERMGNFFFSSMLIWAFFSCLAAAIVIV